MFTYIDPTVRERLEAAGKLYRIDRISGGTISVLGPIPMPLHIGGKRACHGGRNTFIFCFVLHGK